MASIQWTVQDGQWVVFFVFFLPPFRQAVENQSCCCHMKLLHHIYWDV